MTAAAIIWLQSRVYSPHNEVRPTDRTHWSCEAIRARARRNSSRPEMNDIATTTTKLGRESGRMTR